MKIKELRQKIMELTTHYENVPVDGGVVCGIDKHRIEEIQIGFNNLIASHERLEKENEELRSGENNWWQRRWVNKDTGEQLLEIRKKWLTAYQCAESYQKMYEEKVKELKKLQRIVACAKEIKFLSFSEQHDHPCITIDYDKYQALQLAIIDDD